MLECNATPELVGQHIKQIEHLESGQKEMSDNLAEIKTDLKELIALLRDSVERSQKSLEDKLEKTEKELGDFKKFLLDLAIKCIAGIFGVGVIAAAWYFSQISKVIVK